MAEKLSAAVAALEQEVAYWRDQAETAWSHVRVYETRANSRRKAELNRDVGKWYVAFSPDESELVGMDMDDPRMFLYGLVDSFATNPGPLRIEVRAVAVAEKAPDPAS